MNIENISQVLARFLCRVDINSIRAYGSGHINDTYFLKNQKADGPDFLLQRINNQVFRDVQKLMENTCIIIDHLKSKLKNGLAVDPEKEVMTLIPTIDGKFFFEDDNGSFWRMCYFLSGTRSYDVVETEKQAFEGGKAFGKFQALLADIPSGIIYDIIPHFHNIQKRLGQLAQAVNDDVCRRVESVKRELTEIEKYAQIMQFFQQPEQLRSLPKRVIHNDTKFNNVLLDENDEGQCVIDLDTVMEGYVAFDFGDSIRTIINTAPEDEYDLDKIQLNVPFFAAYTDGYLQEASVFLTSSEISSLLMGVLLFPYMQAVRFLTDHLNGDKYYKIKFKGHNLQRARAQFNLFEKLFESRELLQAIITEKSNILKTASV